MNANRYHLHMNRDASKLSMTHRPEVPPVFCSQALFEGYAEIHILHRGKVYVLRHHNVDELVLVG